MQKGLDICIVFQVCPWYVWWVWNQTESRNINIATNISLSRLFFSRSLDLSSRSLMLSFFVSLCDYLSPALSFFLLRPTSHFRVYFSLALLICLLGLSRSLSLFLSVTISPPLSLSFSRAQTLTRSDLARFARDDASLPWNKVVSGWLWTLFFSLDRTEWLTGWVTA